MDVSEKEITEMVLKLDTIYRQMEDKQFFLRLNGDVLSYTVNVIAASKARLVDVKRMAEIDAKDADTDYKAIKAQTMRKLIGSPLTDDEKSAKISATAAGELLYGEEEVIQAAKDKNRKEATYNRLKSLVADGHDMCDAIRSRIIDLQGSRKDERVG